MVFCESSQDQIRIISARPAQRKEIMTNTQDEDLLQDYEFHYGKAQPNRFAEQFH